MEDSDLVLEFKSTARDAELKLRDVIDHMPLDPDSYGTLQEAVDVLRHLSIRGSSEWEEGW